MKLFSSFSILALLLFSNTCLAGKGNAYLVFDDHLPSGRGATGQHIIFKIGDPLYKVEGPGPCMDSKGRPALFLGGFAFGHPNPHDKDPKAICGHGVVAIVTLPDEGRPPRSILPIAAPMPDEVGTEVTLDSAQFIRSFLPRLDKSEGDNVPVVLQIRKDIQLLDVVKALKTIPKREVKR